MAAHMGTGIQMAAVGPQNKFLDVDPQMTMFRRKTVQGSPHACEPHEDLPLQTARFGTTAVFEVSRRGDMLGDMHVQFSVPPVQPRLGLGLPRAPFPAVSGAPRSESAASVALGGAAAELRWVPEGGGPELSFGGPGLSWELAGGGGRAYAFDLGDGHTWEVVHHATGLVVASVASAPGAASHTWAMDLSAAGVAGLRVPLPPGSAAAVAVTPSGFVTRNDTWESPLAHVLLRRVRLVVDELVVHDQERLWYDLCDRLALREGHARGKAEMLGTGLSLAEPHVVLLPLRFMCCSGTQTPRAYFPTVLVPNSLVRVDLELEALSRCVPARPVLPVEEPASLDVRLVAERIWLDAAERNGLMLSQRMTVMYEDAQDMDALNYVETAEGAVALTARAAVDLSELNRPVRALAWVVYEEPVRRPFEYADAVEHATLQWGSLDRASADGPALSRREVWSHAPRCLPGNVYLHSFALQAWDSAPCGSADFSAIQKPVLRLELKPEAQGQRLKCKVWGLTYNWLRFQDGKVAQVYSG